VSASPPAPRIGVLGGTFDPVHNGHLHIARALREALALDRVIWVPAGRPPHKAGQIVSDDDDRLAMLELALAELPGDEVSRIDIDRAGPSYTADLLELLRAELGPSRFFFLMGEDSLRDLPTWRDPERILRLAELAVAGRPGIAVDLETVTRSLPTARGRVHIVPIPEMAISSSDIRKRVRAGEPIRHLVPAAVADYIEERGLYRNKPHPKRSGEGMRPTEVNDKLIPPLPAHRERGAGG
jgi:nicotinate-nucleotide adenylyltransferase